MKSTRQRKVATNPRDNGKSPTPELQQQEKNEEIAPPPPPLEKRQKTNHRGGSSSTSSSSISSSSSSSSSSSGNAATTTNTSTAVADSDDARSNNNNNNNNNAATGNEKMQQDVNSETLDNAIDDVGENDTADGKREFYSNKINLLREEEKQVRNGTHKEYLTQLAIFDTEKDRMLREAKLHRDLKIAEIEALYLYQVQATDDLYKGSKSELTDRLLADIADTIKRMEDLRDGITTSSNAASRKNRIKTRRGGDADNAGEGGSQDGQGDDDDGDTAGGLRTGLSRAAGGASSGLGGSSGLGNTRRAASTKPGVSVEKNDMPLTFSLDEQLIMDDLRAIHQDWTNVALRFMDSKELEEANIRVERGKLFYNELVIEKATNIVINSEQTREEFYGTVTSISPTEFYCRLADGSRIRILLAHLRSGRCTLSKDVESLKN